MLLRFILWLIIIFIAGKIVGSVVVYLRKVLTPNKHVSSIDKKKSQEKYEDVEDVPYEELP